MYFSKVYLHVFYFLQRIFSYIFETSLHTSYLDEEICIDGAVKFLNIGIVVGPTSHVEIAISDNRGNRIILPHATWKASIERRTDIERLMQSTVPSSSSSSPIQDLNVELVKVCDTKNVKLSLYVYDYIYSLHVSQIELFHRLIKIADEVDDLTQLRIDKNEFDCLIGNLNEVVKEEEMEEESVSAGILEESVSVGVLEDPSPASPLEYPSALTIGLEEEEE
ncbi:hypothetical protein ALC56_03045 [Trachymyrmex septentrionalis]|uniref:Uncharacterized protein n=1 Tax=Trachymyrmex septentrionalis TaxID=34720 RepID=A0A195FRF9_9HYME|nr:hypothetical protein ALC56_03045 [Trachymyrmex septentrionalis]